MIKEIKITNFYSFSEETIVLQPDVNILVGINGSGKSNFFKAVRLLKEGVAGKGLRSHFFDDLGGFDNIFFKGHKKPKDIEIEYTFDSEEITKGNYGYHFASDVVYTIKIIRSGTFQNYYIHENIATKGEKFLVFTNGIGHLKESFKGQQKPNTIKYTEFNPQELVLKEVSDTERYSALASLRNAIKDIVVYEYFDTTPRSSIRRTILATSDRRLNSDGSNLTQILNTIKINYKANYNKIVEMLQEVNPNFSGFDYHIFGGGNIELMLEEKGLESSIHVSSISDGTLKYLCLLAILYNPERGKFICIDEPETGLHPDMILNIANAIKEASEQSTLIISTHSVSLLDYFNIDNLLVIEKDENNATRVVTFKEEQFKGWYEEFAVGKMWIAGDFGGVRYGG